MRRILPFLFFLIMMVAFARPDWIKNIFPLGEKVIKTISPHSSMIQLDPYAMGMGGTLISPMYDQEKVGGLITFSGFIRKAPDLPSSHVWIEVTYLGEKRTDLPTSAQYYVPIKQGKFEQKVRLFCGRGKYAVTIRVAGEEKNMYYPFASFQVINKSPVIARDIGYSMAAKEAGLQITSPEKGYLGQSNKVYLRGQFTKRYVGRNLLIQVRKGLKVWRKVFLYSGCSFQEQVPLLFGKGIHEIQLMIPDLKRPEYYVEGATFFVQNESQQTWNPIQYTSLYKERGIELSTPIAGGSYKGRLYRVAGNINPLVKNARKTDHLVVRTIKGKDEATYFIPVSNYHFDSNIYFRFGSGTYIVDLLVSENTTRRRDYFRFLTAAQFEVSVQGIGDERYLLPSRGINSDNKRIIHLANKLVQGNPTDIEKARAIYTYVTKNMTYDVLKLKLNTFSWRDSSLTALQSKKGVCQDYVFLSLALLRAVGIPCRFVEGISNGQSHAWVECKVGDRWISMDPTWGSGYILEGKFVKKMDESYFNPSARKLSKTHKRIGVIY